ncbi:polysaccharide biosynthesis/export family protein [Hoylesella enoeca]|uniref:Sugar transporter n=1 Tax=Hoylesella enoeca TaxID=76123 RepID=A0A0S2KJC3_9BACT|nr:polysaccharide biosynthesis/export family protein [Hoylesella enoeca]ALO48417.1 sugar transporter [Hoylesella enoeca]
MKKLLIPFASFAFLLLICSCAGSKKVAYLQNADEISLADSKGLYDARIMPKDMLTVTVSTITPEAAKPFNLTVANTSESSSASVGVQSYLVDNDGNINFPVVGHIHVVGLTKNQCQDLIRDKVKPYLAETENPVVTVRMSSYHVTVLGEVSGPKVIPVTTEKMNILEALASAGDLTIYGKRNNVMLIREDATGEKSVHRLNLNDANLINSPYYYLQQNDIVYVQPNGVKAKGASIGPSTSLWFSFVGIVTSVASLLYNILRK